VTVRIAFWTCVAEAILSLARALAECDECRRGFPLAWAGAGFYALLAGLCLTPRARSAATLMMQGAFAIHLSLAADMIRRGEFCALCASAGLLSVVLLCCSIAEDRKPAWKWGLEFLPLVLAAFAISSSILPPPVPESAVDEVVVFQNANCPRCVEFEREVLSRLPPEVRVKRLDAAEFDFVRVTPTVLIQRQGKRRVIEGACSLEQLLAEVK
jgi:hypothetical protein